MPHVTVRIVNRTRDAVICERAEVADSVLRRLRGLLGREGLAPGAGMLFKGESSIHSAFMRFEFDAVFTDRAQRVVAVSEQIPPWRVRACRRARNVLELPGGEIARLGIEVGDQLEVAEASPGEIGH